MLSRGTEPLHKHKAKHRHFMSLSRIFLFFYQDKFLFATTPETDKLFQ